MPEVTIDQSQLDILTKTNKLFNSLLEDTGNGLALKKMIKGKYPEAKIPDLDLIEQVTAPLSAEMAALKAQNDALTKRLDEDAAAREAEKAEGNLTSALDKVQKQYGFTEDGMKKVLETMRDRNLAHDPEAAAALIQSQMPKAAPTSSRSSLVAPRLDIYGMQTASDKLSEDYKKLHTQPWAFLEDTAIDVLNEFANMENAA
jgi:hypothetical protein